MTTNKWDYFGSPSCIKDTLKTTLDDKKVDYKWTTLSFNLIIHFLINTNHCKIEQ